MLTGLINWLDRNSHGFVSTSIDPKHLYGIFDKCCKNNIQKLDEQLFQCSICKRVFTLRKTKRSLSNNDYLQ